MHFPSYISSQTISSVLLKWVQSNTPSSMIKSLWRVDYLLCPLKGAKSHQVKSRAMFTKSLTKSRYWPIPSSPIVWQVSCSSEYVHDLKRVSRRGGQLKPQNYWIMNAVFSLCQIVLDLVCCWCSLAFLYNPRAFFFVRSATSLQLTN